MAVLTSVSGTQSSPTHAAYGAAKAALVHAVKTMAVEWAEDNIRVNSVAPGGIVTPRLPDTPERIASFRNSAVPMRRRGVPEDIANALLYLTSDMSDYVTGHTLLVDGGVMAGNLRYKHGKLG